jgi:hypothetical protein
MFYLTNAAAGTNLYGCTTANTWTPEGSGGIIQSATQLTDLQPIRTSSTVLTIGLNCSATLPCNVALNGVTYKFTGPMTVTNAAGSPLTARGYVSDGSDGQSAGTFVVGNSAASGLTCSGGCVVLNNVSAFPVSAGLVTEFAWTATGVNGQWDVTGYTDWRPFQGGGNRLYSTNGNCAVSQSSVGAGLTCSGGLWSDLHNPNNTTSLNMGPYASSFSWTDPNLGDPNNHYAMQFTNNVDANTTTNNNYSTEAMFENSFFFNWGQALYGNGTNAKKTATINSQFMVATGSGQNILNNMVLNCWGMSDCARESTTITYAGGPVAGDEARGFSVVSRLQQLGNLVKTSLTSGPTRSACPAGMALTQSVTANVTPQTVTVTSNTGCQVGDWMVVDWNGPSGYPNWDPVQLTAVGSGTITGRFTANHNSGATVKAGVVVNVSNTFEFGQDRVLVDLSGALYATGTATAASTNMTGSGTSWSTSMVGGDATSTGCFAFTGDDQTYAPFGTGANALRSWWEIAANSITNATTLQVFSFSVAASGNYNGVGSGAYAIRPCARIVFMNGDQHTAVLSPNSFAWTSGDTVEQALTPYPDNQGFNYSLAAYTPGGTYRGFMNVANSGGQPQGSVFTVQNLMAGNNSSSSPSAFHAFLADGGNFAANPELDWIIDFGGSLKNGAIRLPDPFTYSGKNHITWNQVESQTWIGTAQDGNGSTTGLELCGLGASGGAGGGCLFEDLRNVSDQYTAGVHAPVGGIQLDGNTHARDVFFALRNAPGANYSELFLHGADFGTYKGKQYSDTGGGTGGFVMEYTDNGGTSMPLYEMGGGAIGNHYGAPGFYVLPQNVATGSNNYASNFLGVTASIWNGASESPIWSYWDLEPDSNATNATSHAYLYGPCASPITSTCQYLAAGLDGLKVTGPETADYWVSTLGTAISSAATIAPTKYTTHVTGTTSITTITPPTLCAASGKSCMLILIPDAATVYNTGGNIANAVTATVNVPVFAVYDNATGKWYLR